jgi:hypothetical protein
VFQRRSSFRKKIEPNVHVKAVDSPNWISKVTFMLYRPGRSYHHVFNAVVDARGSVASGLMGLRLIPIANEVLAAWPEYRYATKECVSGEMGKRHVKLGIP